MSDFVNKIKTKDGTEYSINDERVPQILEESKGKFLKVNDEGNLEFADVPSGGTKLYKHRLSYADSMLEFVSLDNTEKSFHNLVCTLSTYGSLFGVQFIIKSFIDAGPTKLLEGMYPDANDNNIMKTKRVDISTFLSEGTDTVTEL